MFTRLHISLHDELRRVGERFRDIVRGGRIGPGKRFDRGLRADNLVLALPFLLIEDAPFPGALEAARRMALANASGAAHFLLQDDELDGDAEPSPARATLSDLCLMVFSRTYTDLACEGPLLWQHIDRYLGEYEAALVWERTVLRSRTGRSVVGREQLETALRHLGRRLALLKSTCAAVTLSAGSLAELGLLEEALDRFHAGYQLADDMDDLEADLNAGRWTLPAWMLACALDRDAPGEIAPDEARALMATSGVEESVLGVIDGEYAAASGAALEAGFKAAAGFLERLRARASISGAWRSRRSSLSAALDNRPRTDGGTPGAGFHAFGVRGDTFLYDAASGLFLEVDPAAADMHAAGTSSPARETARFNYGGAADEAAEELERLTLCGGFSPTCVDAWPPDVGAAELAPITALSLHVTTGCNLRCGYCYLPTGRPVSAMSLETARRAVDLLMRESFGSDRVSLIFFGGEPLLERDLVLEVASYARRRGRDAGRSVALHMTTNGTLLTPDVAAGLNAAGVSVMVSLDGGASEHDGERRDAEGRGSFESIARNLRSLPNDMRVGARATVTPGSTPLPEIVREIVSLGCVSVHLAPASGLELTDAFAERLIDGFEELAAEERAAAARGGRLRVGNFAEALRMLDSAAPRLAPCGAGARYYSVEADGSIQVCHRFAGEEERSVGHVVSGVDRGAAREQLAALRSFSEACTSCWARHLCGGPCLHDVQASPGRTTGRTSPWCRVVRRVLELSMWIYAGIPDGRRREVLRTAHDDCRPERDHSAAGVSPSAERSARGNEAREEERGGGGCEDGQACERVGAVDAGHEEGHTGE
ncbi:MAG: radical SAM protein [Candidatus Eisenbacteria bacterium]|nr:radical SAM protein [Candidatus Eisenbacteria bacterium]